MIELMKCILAIILAFICYIVVITYYPLPNIGFLYLATVLLLTIFLLLAIVYLRSKRVSNKYTKNIELNYSQDKIAKRILRNIKIIRKVEIMLIVICVAFFTYKICLSKDTYSIIHYVIGFCFVALLLKIIIVVFINIYRAKILNLNYPEGLLNLDIYLYKISLKKVFSTVLHLSNIALSYYLMGDIEDAKKIINYAEEINNMEGKIKKSNKEINTTLICNLKAAIAFRNNDIEEFKRQALELKELLKTIPPNYSKVVNLSINIKEAILENNMDEVNRLCDEMDKIGGLYYKVGSAYNRAQMLENNNCDGWRDYYQYVADNGNTLFIAKKAKEKLTAQ